MVYAYNCGPLGDQLLESRAHFVAQSAMALGLENSPLLRSLLVPLVMMADSPASLDECGLDAAATGIGRSVLALLEAVPQLAPAVFEVEIELGAHFFLGRIGHGAVGDGLEVGVQRA